MTTISQRRYENVVPMPGVEGGIPVALNPRILASNMNLMHVINQASKMAGNDEEKANNDPSITSAAHQRMMFRIFLMESILGGTETMRAAGKTLLPMYTAEKQSDWQTRLSQAVLFNYTERTSADLTGRLFKTPPKLPTVEDGLDPTLVPHLDDVDGAGMGMTEFMREWFTNGFNMGLYHVLVNTPRADTASAADRKTPTWTFIHPDNLIFAHAATLADGSVILDHVRIMETRSEMQGFREVERRYIRVIEVGMTRVYRENPKARGKEPKWILDESFQTDWDRVPLVTFYANKTGFMEAIPPLQDLAYLNVRHWQSYSDQANILTVTRFPILAAIGVSGTRGSKTIAPKKMFRIPDSSGDLKYVEHTGAAIRAGTEDLETLEHMMSNYGSEFLKGGKGTNTAATTRALDSSESTSSLVGMANTFEDAVHELLVMTMRAFDSFDARKEVPRVEFVVDLSISAIDSTELTTLDLARRRKDVSRKAFLQELSRRDIMSDTFDPDVDFKQLEEEIAKEKEMGIFKVENEFAIPNADNAQDRAASGKSSRDKPDNGKGDTGEGDNKKDSALG